MPDVTVLPIDKVIGVVGVLRVRFTEAGESVIPAGAVKVTLVLLIAELAVNAILSV
jgi:hypothetical protein